MMSNNAENEYIYVMVYGTLMRGQYNNGYMDLAQAIYVDDVVSDLSEYRMVGVSNSFPGIVAGDKKFEGELFKVTASGVVHYLDKLEGYPYMYDRGFITVKSKTSDMKYTALVYFLTPMFIKETKLDLVSPYITLKNDVYKWN